MLLQRTPFHLPREVIVVKKAMPFVAIGVVFLCGCAATGPGIQTGASGQATVVPGLKVAADCGACVVAPHIPALIVQGYRKAAAEGGARVANEDTAALTIKEYSARDGVARMLAGAFAGKDEIKAVVSYRGRQFSVEEYYRNAWMGIDSVADQIGAMAFEQLKLGNAGSAVAPASQPDAEPSTLASSDARNTGNYPRTLSGPQAAAHFARYTQVQAKLKHRPPFTVTFHPQGGVERDCPTCRVPFGVGTMTLKEGLVCLQWRWITYPNSGCYQLVQTGPRSFELRTPDSETAMEYSVASEDGESGVGR